MPKKNSLYHLKSKMSTLESPVFKVRSYSYKVKKIVMVLLHYRNTRRTIPDYNFSISFLSWWWYDTTWGTRGSRRCRRSGWSGWSRRSSSSGDSWGAHRSHHSWGSLLSGMSLWSNNRSRLRFHHV